MQNSRSSFINHKILRTLMSEVQTKIKKFEIDLNAPFVSHASIFIDASPETVWKIQSDINHWKDWNPRITKAVLNGSLEEGAKFKWTSGGFTVVSTLKYIEKNRLIAWSGEAIGSKARHVWVFEPEKGGTRVTTEESMSGWLVSIIKPIIPKFLEQSLEVWLKHLKTKVESINKK